MTRILDTDEALHRELNEIEHRRVPDAPPPGAKHETAEQRALRLGPTALCLSGGGIRSAAFCLGVVQSLAAKQLLNKFDYLSTVSGGGYIGGWLQILFRNQIDIAAVEKALGDGEAKPLRRLRGFTNYLTPQTGAFSADTWAGIMLYLRNLIINWLVFLPLLLLLGLAPLAYRTLLSSLHDDAYGAVIALAVAALCLGWAAFNACMSLPSHRPAADFAKPAEIIRTIVAPAVAWAFMVPITIEYCLTRKSAMLMALGPTTTSFTHDRDLAAVNAACLQWLHQYSWIISVTYVLALCGGYWAAWRFAAFRSESSDALFRGNAWRWVVATLVSASLIRLGLGLLYSDSSLDDLARAGVLGTNPWLVNTETALTIFAPFCLMGMHVLQTTFYVALRREALFAELDREWLARLSGLVIRIGLAWLVLAGCCLVLPKLLAGIISIGTQEGASPRRLSALFGGSTILGGIAAWLGKQTIEQVSTLAGKSGGWTGWLRSPTLITLLLAVLASIFAVGLLVVAATIEENLLGAAQDQLVPPAWLDQFGRILHTDHHVVGQWINVVLQLILAALLGLSIRIFGRINVNRFSMHAAYRNRLTRAFLGSARNPVHRRPDPFTGFALAEGVSDDNPRLKDFLEVPSGQRLFPVINMTLNVTAGSNTAWAERKGECFIATPLVCGAAELRHPDQASRADQDSPLGAFVPTECYAGMETRHDAKSLDQGARLGSAMTISGAAISPNWGYHSSRSTALLMALFNVRLGAWLPNPSRRQPAESLQLAGPRHSLWALLGEVLGMTTDDGQAVYLSDGGHFENLGLYEMLRRRCRRLIVVDATEDADCTFFDLGNAIRKAEVDLSVCVTMRPMQIYSRAVLEKDKPVGAMGFAFGDVCYPDGGTGRLIYVKPSLLAAVPAEVQAFARTHGSFPHASTLQQWFNEDEFESYRALGAWQTRQVMSGMTGAEVDDLFDAASRACPK